MTLVAEGTADGLGLGEDSPPLSERRRLREGLASLSGLGLSAVVDMVGVRMGSWCAGSEVVVGSDAITVDADAISRSQ